MTTKNESLWLASGQAGENQARALNKAIEFTRVEVGDANGVQPTMDTARTALVHKVADGELLSHEVDPNDANQRIVKMSIPPNDNYNARELILYAKYGNTEFAHTYFRLADIYPVRTIENGGSQVTLKWTIRVSQYTDVKVMVSPNLAYVTEDYAEELQKPKIVTGDQDAFINRRHVFKAHADLQLLASPDGNFITVKVLESVDLDAGQCRIIPPAGKKISIGGTLFDDAVIETKGVEFTLDVINGVYTA